MNPNVSILIASSGVFFGSLLADILLGDGVQAEDVHQAVMVALIAGVLQWWLNRSRG